MSIIQQFDGEYWFPVDVETERLLLGVLILVPPSGYSVTRPEIVKATRPSWFFDQWHRDVYLRVSNYRDADGEALLANVLSSDHRAKWPNAVVNLGQLFVNCDDSSRSGLVRLWRQYARTLKRVYDRRMKLIVAAGQFEDAINECRDSVFVVGGGDEGAGGATSRGSGPDVPLRDQKR